MRTTVTIAEDLLKETMRVSGKAHYSEAIIASLKDYLAMRKRLEFLDRLFDVKLPHSHASIKRSRRKGLWSS